MLSKKVPTKILLAIGLLALSERVLLAADNRKSITNSWNSAALQGIRYVKLGAPVVARALAIVHTCVYDAWAAYDERAVGTQLKELRYAVLPRSERKPAKNKPSVTPHTARWWTCCPSTPTRFTFR